MIPFWLIETTTIILHYNFHAVHLTFSSSIRQQIDNGCKDAWLFQYGCPLELFGRVLVASPSLTACTGMIHMGALIFSTHCDSRQKSYATRLTQQDCV